jgi:alkylation response protein AidB-like acyl-CoA dehydrogenase
MKRDLYTDDHESFRDVARQFVGREVVPKRQEWNEAHLTGQDIWLTAGRQGIVGVSGPAEYGGAAQFRDFRYR